MTKIVQKENDDARDDNDDSGGEIVCVVYTDRANANVVKRYLQNCDVLNTTFRMVPADTSAAVATTITNTTQTKDIMISSKWIAIPVTDVSDDVTEHTMVQAIGYQNCPYSTKVLGNGGFRKATPKWHKSTTFGQQKQQDKQPELSLIQLVILHLEKIKQVDDDDKESDDDDTTATTTEECDMGDLIERVQQLPKSVCPDERLEWIGNDKTMVIPSSAFQGDEFLSLLSDAWTRRRRGEKISFGKEEEIGNIMTTKLEQDFYSRLAKAYHTPRIVRRGSIDPNSRVRQSGHVLVWPYNPRHLFRDSEVDNILPPLSLTSMTPGWICVTEQGIKQSFDLTRVMFSRGNISEKIRFGRHLVQPGNVVLDLYAGIGYYTLPALVHGRASWVYACEWNVEAAFALQYNVDDNKVSDRVQILVGDCRELCKKHRIINCVDRVSLGLLPSSEGGWRTAILALKQSLGGWLHVHGNVPVQEKIQWALWVCASLYRMALEEKIISKHRNDYIVLCVHIEKVKSFAPTVCHYVADVFAGPREYLPFDDIKDSMRMMDTETNSTHFKAGLWTGQDAQLVSCPNDLQPPSCALSPNGILHQEWMI